MVCIAVCHPEIQLELERLSCLSWAVRQWLLCHTITTVARNSKEEIRQGPVDLSWVKAQCNENLKCTHDTCTSWSAYICTWILYYALQQDLHVSETHVIVLNLSSWMWWIQSTATASQWSGLYLVINLFLDVKEGKEGTDGFKSPLEVNWVYTSSSDGYFLWNNNQLMTIDPILPAKWLTQFSVPISRPVNRLLSMPVAHSVTKGLINTTAR